jgi:hypothetical protein
MGNVRIDLSDNLHRNLKRRAIDEGIPMRELLVKALHEYIAHNPPLPPTVSPDQTSERGKKREKKLQGLS